MISYDQSKLLIVSLPLSEYSFCRIVTEEWHIVTEYMLFVTENSFILCCFEKMIIFTVKVIQRINEFSVTKNMYSKGADTITFSKRLIDKKLKKFVKKITNADSFFMVKWREKNKFWLKNGERSLTFWLKNGERSNIKSFQSIQASIFYDKTYRLIDN
jgi:hypothetical protein